MMIITIMKKRSDATRTVRACCSKADPHYTQTGAITIPCAAASLARSVIIIIIIIIKVFYSAVCRQLINPVAKYPR